jgi:phage shock protein A
MRSKVAREEALGRANGELVGTDDEVDLRFHVLEREQRIDTLLKELKAKKGFTS